MRAYEMLCDRDKEIVKLILSGYTVPQIAEKIKYSEQSVKTYKRNVYKALQVHDKKELYEKINNIKE